MQSDATHSRREPVIGESEKTTKTGESVKRRKQQAYNLDREFTSEELRKCTLPVLWCFHDDDHESNYQATAVCRVMGLNFSSWIPDTSKTLWDKISARLPWSDNSQSLRMIEIATGQKCGPPFPDIVVASGQVSVHMAKVVSEMSSGATVTVCAGESVGDVKDLDILVSSHAQYIGGTHVCNTGLRLYDDKSEYDPQVNDAMLAVAAELTEPRISVLIDETEVHKFTTETVERLIEAVDGYRHSTGGSAMIMTTARISNEIYNKCKELVGNRNWVWIWDRQGLMPWGAALKQSTYAVVTDVDSPYLSHALALRKPVLRHRLERVRTSNYAVADDDAESRKIASFTTRTSSTWVEPPPFEDKAYNGVEQVASFIQRILLTRGYHVSFDQISGRQARREEELQLKLDKLREDANARERSASLLKRYNVGATDEEKQAREAAHGVDAMLAVDIDDPLMAAITKANIAAQQQGAGKVSTDDNESGKLKVIPTELMTPEQRRKATSEAIRQHIAQTEAKTDDTSWRSKIAELVAKEGEQTPSAEDANSHSPQLRRISITSEAINSKATTSTKVTRGDNSMLRIKSVAEAIASVAESNESNYNLKRTRDVYGNSETTDLAKNSSGSVFGKANARKKAKANLDNKHPDTNPDINTVIATSNQPNDPRTLSKKAEPAEPVDTNLQPAMRAVGGVDSKSPTVKATKVPPQTSMDAAATAPKAASAPAAAHVSKAATAPKAASAPKVASKAFAAFATKAAAAAASASASKAFAAFVPKSASASATADAPAPNDASAAPPASADAPAPNDASAAPPASADAPASAAVPAPVPAPADAGVSADAPVPKSAFAAAPAAASVPKVAPDVTSQAKDTTATHLKMPVKQPPKILVELTGSNAMGDSGFGAAPRVVKRKSPSSGNTPAR